MSHILFYYPSNKRSIAIETLLIELSKKVEKVSLLTTCPKGALHRELEKYSIMSFTNSISKGNSFLYYVSQILFLIRFCKKNEVDFVYSNLQHVNLISCIAQYLMTARVFIFRHHFKFVSGQSSNLSINKNEQFFDKVINKLAKVIIVPSSGVYNGMKLHENVKIENVKIIPYTYDFSKYGQANKENVKKLKLLYPEKLILIMCARLIPFKRHNIVFKIVKKLINEGLDIILLVLDEGPEKQNLDNYIKKNYLEKNIIMLGFKKDFLDYMAISEMLIHPSLTEASNSVVKEMALMNKPVAVCKGVGDFSDYIINDENSFLLNAKTLEIEIENIIRNAYKNKYKLKKLGRKLNKVVKLKFDKSEKIIDMHLKLNVK